MANKGDLFLFSQFPKDMALGVHDLENDTILVGISSDTSIDQDLVNPAFGSNITQATNATSKTTNIEVFNVQNVTTIDIYNGSPYDPVTWLQDAGGFTTGKWGIIYNSTASNRAIGFVQLVTTPASESVSQVSGDVTIDWNNTTGICTITVTNFA